MLDSSTELCFMFSIKFYDKEITEFLSGIVWFIHQEHATVSGSIFSMTGLKLNSRLSADTNTKTLSAMKMSVGS